MLTRLPNAERSSRSLPISRAGPSKLAQRSEEKLAGGESWRAWQLAVKALDKDPGNADALNLMGYSYRKLGEFDEAMEYYEDALKLQPDHIGANEYMGELYLEMKNLPKAEERLAAAMGLLGIDFASLSDQAGHA